MKPIVSINSADLLTKFKANLPFLPKGGLPITTQLFSFPFFRYLVKGTFKKLVLIMFSLSDFGQCQRPIFFY